MVAILGANSVSGGYEVDNSLRLNGPDSAYLNRTATAGDRKTWTWSGWVKLVLGGNGFSLMRCWVNDDNFTGLTLDNNGQFSYISRTSNSNSFYLNTTPLLRDPSAWYHFVIASDTTQATAANRVKFYVNGVQITAFDSSTYPAEDGEFRINENNIVHKINRIDETGGNGTAYSDAYLAEHHFIDGAAKAPSDFGETDDNGVWIPKEYTGDYGTNGYYLEFKETGTGANASGIGADTSGETNHWTVNNLAATDVTTDTPTNNFATFNALLPHTQTLSEGNTKVSNATTTPSLSTLGASSGKWYAEIKFVSGTHCRIGFANENGVNEGFIGANSWIKINGQIFYHDNTAINSQGQAIAAGDIVMMAVDIDAGKLWWGKNGTWDDNASGTGVPADGTNPTYTGDTGISDGGFIFFGVASGSGAIVYSANFGNAPYAISSGNADANGYGNFEYAVPSGYYSLCTKNLAQYG